MIYRNYIKRGLDIIIAAFLLVILSPILLLVAIAVRYDLGSPVLFCQPRTGYREKTFFLVKFRTMKDLYDENGKELPDDVRLTSFGKILRSISLDELPELWNILKGEMSFIGPRPLLTEYLHLYSWEQSRRHNVVPGLTGWAQVNGRNNISWQNRFHLDLWYVDHLSIWLDFKIVLMTLGSVLKREGISAKGEVTMPRFTGNHHHG